MRRMQARYSGYCRKCKQRISVGQPIVYGGKGNTFHAACYDGLPDDEKQEIASPSPRKAAAPRPKVSDVEKNVFSIDWSDLKQKMLAAFEGNFRSFPNHERHVKSHLVNPSQGWQGVSGDDCKRWLVKGYETDAIKGLGDFSPPLREKRKYRYAEEGDEFHYDLAASGDEKFMGIWTKRDSIPGAAVQIALGFNAGVPARILNEYAAWICKAIYALDLAGIDSEISIHHTADGMMNKPGTTDTRIRVKKENEVVDFHSFSGMFSPAQFRSYMFCAFYLHCESEKTTVSAGHGHARRFFREWGVRWDAESQKLFIDCDYDGSHFPAERMEMQLRQALKDMTGKG